MFTLCSDYDFVLAYVILYALCVILTQALYPGIVYLPEHYKKVIWCGEVVFTITRLALLLLICRNIT